MNQPAQQIDLPNEADAEGQPKPAALPALSTRLSLLDRAVDQGASVEILKELMDLQERHEANQARRAFDNAMAELRGNLPAIIKTREVDFTSSKGRTHYRYEDLSAVTEALSPVMARHGLSFRWRTDTTQQGAVSVTCIISHRDGHYEETTLSAGHDSSGNKNSIQAIGSTTTYLQRYTLKAAVGVAAAEDDDGRASSGNADPISKEQHDKLAAFVREISADFAGFCRFLKVRSLAELPSAQFDHAWSTLEQKKREWAKTNLKRPAEVSGRKEETANSRDRTEAITDTQPGGGRKPSPTSVEESAPAADAPGAADEGPGATGSETAVRSQSPGFSGPGADLINNALAAQMEAQNPRKGFENLLDRAGHPTGRVGKALDRVRHFYQRFEDGEIDRDELSERVAAIIDGSIPV